MLSRYFITAAVLITVVITACSRHAGPYDGDDFIGKFEHTAAHHPSLASELADSLSESVTMPFIEGARVLFLHQSDARKVEWRGDFDSWGRVEASTLKGNRIGRTSWFYAVSEFPSDARLSYKIVENDEDWLLDPLNPKTQLGGAGYDSMFRMPEYSESPWVTIPQQKGTTRNNQNISSSVMGHDIIYSIHTTPGFDPQKSFGLLYVTDASEYMHPEMGNLTNSADTLETAGKIIPLKIILVDPRHPETEENLRADYFVEDPRYTDFFALELKKLIENELLEPKLRAILGTSFGGFFATRLTYQYPEIFPHALIQSPAYWPDPEMLGLWEDVQADPSRKISLTYSTFFDGGDATAWLYDVIEPKFNVHLQTANDGHSWGAWRNQIPDMLIHVFAPME